MTQKKTGTLSLKILIRNILKSHQNFFFFFVKKQKEKSSIWYSLSYPDIYSCGKNKCIVYLFITFLFGHIIVLTMMFNLNDFPDEQKKKSII